MTDTKDEPQPNRPSGVFGKIPNEDYALKMAKTGGVAGFALTVSEAAKAVLSYSGLDLTTWKPVAKIDITPMNFIIIAVTLPLLLLFLWMSWRIYTGKGIISPIILMIFLIYQSYVKYINGSLIVALAIINSILIIYLFGATRAVWYLKRAQKSSNPVNEF